MTAPFESPHILAVRCPNCGGQATFESVEIVRIARKRDVPFFQNHRLLEYEFFRDNIGNGWHAAMFYAGLHVQSTEALVDLPEGYTASNWQHSQYLYGNHCHLGSVRCSGCGLRRKHSLDWPKDAFYQVEHKGHVLWAYHRETAIVLQQYLQSTTRRDNHSLWRSFLIHIPSVFLEIGSRDQLVKKLDRLLREG